MVEHAQRKNAPAVAAIVILVIAVATIGFFTGRGPGAAPSEGGAPSASKKLTVTAGVYPLSYFASRVGGDKADVVNVTPAGAEPHDYEPTARDEARIENSDMLVLVGPSLELWGDDARKTVDPSKTTVVVAGEGLATAKVETQGKMVGDPHVWLSPPLAEQMVDRIAQGYARIDPQDAAYFRANADALKGDLEAVDAEYAEGLASCARRDFVTSHAAFGYLAARYGLHQVPIAGLSPDAEPSPKALADVAALAKEKGIRYVFFESLVSPKLSDTIAEEVGAKTLVLDPIEGISPEDLAAGEDFLTKMRSNLANLRIALQCGN